MSPAIPCKDRFCFLCGFQHNSKGVPVSRPSVKTKVQLVWGERTDDMLGLRNAPTQICPTCNARLGTNPKQYIQDWVRPGVQTRHSASSPSLGERGSPPIDWSFAVYCDGDKEHQDCYFCSHMGAKNVNKKRKRSGRPTKKEEGTESHCVAAATDSSPSHSPTIPVVMLVNKDFVGQGSFQEGSAPLQFSQLSTVEKHAILVGASEEENLSAQVSTGCASAFRKQQRQSKGHELTMAKIRGKPVTYQQVFSKQLKPRMEISLDLLNKIQTTATLSNKALERIRALLQSQLGEIAAFPSKEDLRKDRAAMKADWRAVEIEGGIVAMSQHPVDDLRARFGSDCIMRISGDSGGGLFKLLAAPVNQHSSHYGVSGQLSPYLLCIGDIPEKREPMAKICSEVGSVFREYRTILSGDLKWIQVILGLTTTGCPYCLSSGKSKAHRMVYDGCESSQLRTTLKAKELAELNQARPKSHINGQRFYPLYEFDGSPFLAVACPVLHLGMNLIKALLNRYAKEKKGREKLEQFLFDNYGVRPSLPVSSSSLDRKFIQSFALTGKDCAKLAAEISEQVNAEAVWTTAGYEGEAAIIIKEWGYIRHLVYSEHDDLVDDDMDDWIGKVDSHLQKLKDGVKRIDLPITLSVHVVIHHLRDSLEALRQSGVAPWSVTEEVIESLHNVINKESSCSMIKCMTRADGIKHLGATYNTKRSTQTASSLYNSTAESSRPRRSCADYKSLGGNDHVSDNDNSTAK